MQFSDEMEAAIRAGLDALAEGVLPGMHVVIRVNGRPVAVLVLAADCGERHGAIEAGYYHQMETLTSDN